MTLLFVEKVLEASDSCAGLSNNLCDLIDIDAGALKHIRVINKFNEPSVHLQARDQRSCQQHRNICDKELLISTSLFHNAPIS